MLPDLALVLARLAVFNQDELAARKQYDYLARVYGPEHATRAWRQACNEYDEEHADAQLWQTTADEYEITDEDAAYIERRLIEDGYLKDEQ